MNARQLPATDYLTLKAAFRSLVRQCGGTNTAAALTRVAPSQVSDYGNPEKATQAPVDVVADLEAEIGNPIVTRVMAEIAEHVVIREVTAMRPAACLRGALGSIGKASGDLIACLATADRDGNGVLEGDELDTIEPELDEAMRVLAELKAAIRAKRDGDHHADPRVPRRG